MKHTGALILLLAALCSASFAVILFVIEAPQDDREARAWAAQRPEIRPLHLDYTNLIQTRLWKLTFSEAKNIFGQKVEAATNWWGTGTNHGGIGSGPSLKQRPADLVLPLFAATGGSNGGGSVMMMVSGLHSTDPTQNKSHTDLYAVSDVAYVELYSQLNGETVQNALIYFRADNAFLPLKSTNDFSARLEWERKKFGALQAWFDRHLPVGDARRPRPNAQLTQPDPIDALVTRLSASHGLWINGVSPTLNLPATASTEEVVARVFQMTGFDQGRVSRHQILETRQVRINDSISDTPYTAVSVDTDLGRKIVLLQHASSSLGWWSRVYDGGPAVKPPGQ